MTRQIHGNLKSTVELGCNKVREDLPNDEVTDAVLNVHAILKVISEIYSSDAVIVDLFSVLIVILNKLNTTPLPTLLTTFKLI